MVVALQSLVGLVIHHLDYFAEGRSEKFVHLLVQLKMLAPALALVLGQVLSVEKQWLEAVLLVELSK